MERLSNSTIIFFFFFFFFWFILSASLITTAEGAIVRRSHGKDAEKLFVFGDSYADTGNLGKLGRDFTRAWYDPYGVTFPGKPTGRYSDGRVLTDFLASFLGIKSPTPYKYRKLAGPDPLSHGMNFAVGGAGVYDTGNFQKNLAAQIDTFEDVITKGLLSKKDLQSSVALVCIAGNDYAHYADTNPSYANLTTFVRNVTTQMAFDLKRINDLGVRNVVATNLHPLQCTPYITEKFNYTKCDDGVIAKGVANHNLDMEEAMEKVLGQNKNTTFLTLDLNTAFLSVIDMKEGTMKFEEVLKPCCEGIGDDSYCGKLDDKGNKQYHLCSNPDRSFYWDSIHPSQAGWAAAFQILKPSLMKFLHH